VPLRQLAPLLGLLLVVGALLLYGCSGPAWSFHFRNLKLEREGWSVSTEVEVGPSLVLTNGPDLGR
jgi:hypothetical protein